MKYKRVVFGRAHMNAHHRKCNVNWFTNLTFLVIEREQLSRCACVVAVEFLLIFYWIFIGGNWMAKMSGMFRVIQYSHLVNKLTTLNMCLIGNLWKWETMSRRALPFSWFRFFALKMLCTVWVCYRCIPFWFSHVLSSFCHWPVVIFSAMLCSYRQQHLEHHRCILPIDWGFVNRCHRDHHSNRSWFVWYLDCLTLIRIVDLCPSYYHCHHDSLIGLSHLAVALMPNLFDHKYRDFHPLTNQCSYYNLNYSENLVLMDPFFVLFCFLVFSFKFK